MKQFKSSILIVSSLILMVTFILSAFPAEDENIALDKPVTGSTEPGGKSERPFSNLTNGSLDAGEYAMTITGGADSNWVQVDLEAAYPVKAVALWHYYPDGRTYKSNKVALSATGKFEGEEVVVFDSDSDGEYAETADGKMIEFDPIEARYVRNWTDGSNSNGDNHWIEIMVYAAESTAVQPHTKLATTWASLKK